VTGDAAAKVDQARLWERHMRMARHGATPTGGVNRQALTTEEHDAWRELIGWARQLGLGAFTDPIGNLFLRLEAGSANAPPVLTGSHLDSQPTGGKFDGVYGVLAGLEAVQCIVEARVPLRRPIEIVAWMNEEGSRFVPGMMGSSAFAGAASPEQYLTVQDAHGVSVSQGLVAARAAFPDLPQRPLRRPIAAYVEAHIEQGPVLERAGRTIGIVTGIQGKQTFRIVVRGEEAHAGTTPRRDRKDALLAAVDIIRALSDEAWDDEDLFKFTVGRLVVEPNAPSVVPATATFSVDIRHPDSKMLMRLGERVSALCREHAGACEVEVTRLINAPSLAFPVEMQRSIADAAARLRLSAMSLPSAAGHDARYLHAICPTGMIFVPCKGGVSHHEAEWATPADLAAGARVLAEVLVERAG
jgi:beta-ureidopropionase / N-carbamoyl-L-amino-acid hydrolase